MTERNETAEDNIEGRAETIQLDAHLQYLYDYKRDDLLTRELIEQAQQSEVPYYDRDKWDTKFNLLEPKELLKFASNIYKNNETKPFEIELECPWKLLYCARGTVLNGLSAGFYGELYFNSEKHCLLLTIKGTSSWGNKWSDIKNVGLQSGGGEIDSALTFGEKVRELIKEFKCKPMLMITGHSLGGYLAQITTYTITYFFKGEDGSVKSRKTPSDDFGIYTVVFDSPAALGQITKLDQCDPIRPEIFLLPIVNLIADATLINSNSVVGPHLGQVVAVKSFQDLNTLSKWKRLMNARSFHGIINFKDINIDEFLQVEYLPEKKSIAYDARAIPSCMFSVLNFERLHKYLFLADMSAKLANKLPKFKLSNSCIVIEDETLRIEEFIPRVHHFLAKYEDLLDSGIFNGKQIVDMVAFNLWRSGMLKDSHELSLNERWKRIIDQWQDGKKIGGFETHEEMRFVGCLLHNTIPRCFHYNFEDFISLDCDVRDNFLATTNGVLVLIVKDGNQIGKQLYEKSKKVKIFYLLLDSADNSKIDLLQFSALNRKSQDKLKNKEMEFMGNQMCASLVFGSKLLGNLRVFSVYSFHVESALTDELSYCDQVIASEDKKSEFKSATEFALELSKEKLKFVLISSDAGMGKSTALKQIAKTLQIQLPNNWIVNLNLFSIQNELNEKKEKLVSKAEAIEFVRNAVLADRKEDKVLKKVFDWKIEAKEMVLLFDSLDEICPFYRKTADNLMSLLKETGVQIVLTTLPHEGRNFKEAQIFSVEPLDHRGIKRFVLQKFKMMGKQPPSDISTWLKKISGKDYDDEFWSAPLILNMAINIYDPIQLTEAGSEKVHKTNIYDTDKKSEFKSATEFALELSKEKLKFVLISSDAGMGKSTALKQIAKTLQIQLPNNWIVHLNLFSIQNELSEAKEKLNSQAAAIKCIKNAALAEYNEDKVLKKVFDWKLEAKEMVLCLDSLDEICPNHREIAANLLAFLKETELQIVVTTRPHEGKNLKYTEKYKVAKISEVKKVILQKCQSIGKLLPVLNIKQLRSVLWEKEFSDTREHICTILAVNPTKFTSISGMINTGEEQLLLPILIKEDSYELYLALKDVLISQLNQTMRAKNDFTDVESYPLLYFALYKTRKEFTQQLIRDGALEAILFEKDVLHLANEEGLHKDFIGILKSNFNEKHRGMKPLAIAAQNGNKEMVEFLIEKGADVGVECKKYHSTLYCAIKANSAETVELLTIANKADYKHALNWAAELNRKEIFDIIYEKHTPSEYKVERLRESHFYAVKGGHLEIVKHLSKFPEANPKEMNKDGDTFLHIAAENGHLHCMDFIFEYQQPQSIDLRNEDGHTPLMKACCNEFPIETVKWLLDKNADVNIVDNKGNSCLHFVSVWNCCDDLIERIVDILVNAGADINLKDNKGWTPLMYAFGEDPDRYNIATVKCLLKHSPDVNLSDNFGNTCLHNVSFHDGNTCLHNVSFHGVELLLEHQAAPNLENHNGETPLHLAAYRGHADIVELLLNAGADTNLKDKIGRTALVCASGQKDYLSNPDIVKSLLENSAVVNVRDNEGNTCLHNVSDCGENEAVERQGAPSYPLNFALKKIREKSTQQLISDSANIGRESTLLEKYGLHQAIEEGLYKEVMNNFDSFKSNINEKRNCNPQTPLQIAVQKGSKEMVEFLIRKGADVNVESINSFSALIYAIEANNAELVEFLIAKEADTTEAIEWAAILNRKKMIDFFYKKYTPSEFKVERIRKCLSIAVSYGHLQIIKHLSHFPEASHREAKDIGFTFLHIAAQKGHLDCMQFIFEYQQQSVDFRDEIGWTPLMTACWNDNIEIVDWLLRKNADVNAVDDDGISCMHLVAQRENKHIVELLLNSGADINLKDKKGRTAIFYASNEDMVEYLLDNSADINLRDNEGNTCLHF